MLAMQAGYESAAVIEEPTLILQEKSVKRTFSSPLCSTEISHSTSILFPTFCSVKKSHPTSCNMGPPANLVSALPVDLDEYCPIASSQQTEPGGAPADRPVLAPRDRL
jgi:hypothetical protein